MNGSITQEAIPLYERKTFPPIFPISQKSLTGEEFWNLQRPYQKTSKLIEDVEEEKKLEVIQEKKVILLKPKAYIISFSIFLSLSVASGTLILLSAIKNIIVIDPFYLFYGFLASIGLTLTSWKGILSWK
jgi:hypothetical protein